MLRMPLYRLRFQVILLEEVLTFAGMSPMNEIICPHCHKAFKIDDAGYADILKQVRDADFEQQLHERLEIAEREKASAVELATTRLSMDLQREAAGKDAEIKQLTERLKAGEVAQKLAVTEATSPKEAEIAQLKARLANLEMGQKLAITEAVDVVRREPAPMKKPIGFRLCESAC